MPLNLKIEFANDENNSRLTKAVFAYLNNDYHERRGHELQRHFWHNRKTIMKAFRDYKGMAVFDGHDGDKLAGFMIWTLWGHACSAEIDIIEVRADVRRQGISKRMYQSFLERHPDVCVLTASVIDKAVEVFKKTGWQFKAKSSHGPNALTPFYKCMRQGITPQSTLSDGLAVGIYSKVDEPSSTRSRYCDFYQVQEKPAEFQKKYFPIEMDGVGKLKTPIITDFHDEGYMGVYFNKKLIIEGKAKHLFLNPMCISSHNLLVFSKIVPADPVPFYKLGILTKPAPAFETSEQESGAEELDDEKEEKEAETHHELKRKCVMPSSMLFSSSSSPSLSSHDSASKSLTNLGLRK